VELRCDGLITNDHKSKITKLSWPVHSKDNVVHHVMEAPEEV